MRCESIHLLIVALAFSKYLVLFISFYFLLVFYLTCMKSDLFDKSQIRGQVYLYVDLH
jgi:type IV secretory pathway VirB3-like protein